MLFFVSRSSLGLKEFLFRMAQTIISMFALRTRATHFLRECPLDTLRYALTASRSSVVREAEKWEVQGGAYNTKNVPKDAFEEDFYVICHNHSFVLSLSSLRPYFL